MKFCKLLFVISMLQLNYSLHAIRTGATNPAYAPIAEFITLHATTPIENEKSSRCPASGAIIAQSIKYNNGDLFSQCKWPHLQGTDFYLFVAVTRTHTKSFIPYNQQR